MPLDETVPTDIDFVSTHAAKIRELRALLNSTIANFLITGIPNMSSLEANSTTPSVAGVVGVRTANTAPTTIVSFPDGYDGQVIVVVAGDAVTTIQHNTGLIDLRTKANVLMDRGQAMAFIYDTTVWREFGGHRKVISKLKLASFTLAVNNFFIKANATVAQIDVTVVVGDLEENEPYVIKKTDGTANKVIIIPDTLIDDAAMLELTLQNEVVTFIKDGANLTVISAG